MRSAASVFRRFETLISSVPGLAKHSQFKGASPPGLCRKKGIFETNGKHRLGTLVLISAAG